MKSNLFISIRLTIVFALFFCIFYTSLILIASTFVPNKGKGSVVIDGNRVFFQEIGQSFTYDKYFNSRPSAVGYNAAGSGGSNKGPSNPQYLNEVKARIDSFRIHNPDVHNEAIPSELVTASGSGLDPDISIQAAMIQVKRIAKVRHISEDAIVRIIEHYAEKPLFGIFGPRKLNVLKINLALDKLK
mgnify:CR=1 FL=1